MAPPVGLLDHPEPIKESSRMPPRLIDPDDVAYQFAFEELLYSFTPEEHLQFAIAFKRHAKAFQLIAQDVAGRSEKVCLMHYYSVKHDGRFKTRTWDETNLKHERDKYAALQEGDRRMTGITSTDGMVEKPPNGKQQRDLNRLMERVPLDQEIERLFEIVPNATTTHAGTLAAAQKAADKRTLSTGVKKLEAITLSFSRLRERLDVNDIEYFEKLQDDLDWIARKVHGSLKELHAAYEAFVAARTGHAIDPENILVELDIRIGEEYHGLWKQRLIWFHSALTPVLNQIKRVEEPDHKLNCAKLWTLFTSMEDNVMKLDRDRVSIKQKLSVLYKQKNARRNKIEEVEETLANRDAQLLQLKNEVQRLRASISEGLGEGLNDIARGDGREVEEDDEQQGSDDWEDDSSESPGEDKMDFDYEE